MVIFLIDNFANALDIILSWEQSKYPNLGFWLNSSLNLSGDEWELASNDGKIIAFFIFYVRFLRQILYNLLIVGIVER